MSLEFVVGKSYLLYFNLLTAQHKKYGHQSDKMMNYFYTLEFSYTSLKAI